MTNTSTYNPITTGYLQPKPAPAPKKGKTATGQDATPVVVNNKLYETAIVFWAKMSPPSVGHEYMINKMNEMAEGFKAEPMVFVSNSLEAKNNPLLYEDKVRFAKIAFGESVKDTPNFNSYFQLLKEVNKNYDTVHVVTAPHRKEALLKSLNEQNGKLYNFKTIDVHSIEMSINESIQDSIQKNNIEVFYSSLPEKLKLYAEEIYSLTKLGLQLEQTLEKENLISEQLTPQDRIKKAQTMRRFAGKIERMRELSMGRRANQTKLVSRSRHHAILVMREKLAGQNGTNYKDLPAVLKNQVDKKISLAKGAVIRLSVKLLPQIKKLDALRSSGVNRINVNEEELKEMVNTILDQFDYK